MGGVWLGSICCLWIKYFSWLVLTLVYVFFLKRVSGLFPQYDKKSHENFSCQLCRRGQSKEKVQPDGGGKCPVSELVPSQRMLWFFDCRLQCLYRQTAAVILIHHIHPVHPFVVRACSQHLSQITLMHRKNLFFCSSTPDGPVYSVWDWSINPSVVMSLHFNKTALFKGPVHFKRPRT